MDLILSMSNGYLTLFVPIEATVVCILKSDKTNLKICSFKTYFHRFFMDLQIISLAPYPCNF